MPKLPLFRGSAPEPVAWTLVDNDDLAAFERYRWKLSSDGYATCGQRTPEGEPVGQLGRAILGLQRGDPLECDHINRDRLDNRRSNLRPMTRRQNGQNLSPRRDGTSQYRGVSRAKDRGKWLSVVVLDGVRHQLGYFDKELDAARVAARFRAEHMPFVTEDAALLQQT